MRIWRFFLSFLNHSLSKHSLEALGERDDGMKDDTILVETSDGIRSRAGVKIDVRENKKQKA